jgi:hypothetical protein
MDNVPTICLAQWPMDATLWDGDLIVGPMPTLFTEEVEAGTKAILAVSKILIEIFVNGIFEVIEIKFLTVFTTLYSFLILEC